MRVGGFRFGTTLPSSLYLLNGLLERNGLITGSRGLVERSNVLELSEGLDKLLVVSEIKNNGRSVSGLVCHEACRLVGRWYSIARIVRAQVCSASFTFDEDSRSCMRNIVQASRVYSL